MEFTTTTAETVSNAVADVTDLQSSDVEILVATPTHQTAEELFTQARLLLEESSLEVTLNGLNGKHIFIEDNTATLRVMCTNQRLDRFRGLHVDEVYVYQPSQVCEEFFKGFLPHIE